MEGCVRRKTLLKPIWQIVYFGMDYKSNHLPLRQNATSFERKDRAFSISKIHMKILN